MNDILMFITDKGHISCMNLLHGSSNFEMMSVGLFTVMFFSFGFGLIFVYGLPTHFRSFRARSVTLTTLFLGKPPRQFTSTKWTFFRL